MADEIRKWARGIIQDIEKVPQEELEITAREGEEFMRGLIMTRGTNKQWTRPHGDKTGGGPSRVDSGHMLDSVSSNVTTHGSGRGRAFFGWLGGWQGGDEYFRHQEYGFTHNYTGDFIKGMYALTDAADAAFQNLRERIAKRLNGR